MPVELAALMAILLCVMGVVGIVVPVLPGSIFLLAGQAIWFAFGGAPLRWVWFVVAVVLIAIGALASLVLTKKRLKSGGVPPWPVNVALVVGVVAGFFLPAIGLVGGFLIALLLCELFRQRDLGKALRTSWRAVTSVGLGMLVELGMALLSCSVLGASIIVTLNR